MSQVAIWSYLFRRKPNDGILRHLFYNDIDAQDKVLFSEENMDENTYIAMGECTDRLENLEKPKTSTLCDLHLILTPTRSSLMEEEDENEDEDGEQALELDEEVYLVEKNDRPDNGSSTDPSSPGRITSIPKKSFGHSHGNIVLLETLQHPMATLWDEIHIPVQDVFVVMNPERLAYPIVDIRKN